MHASVILCVARARNNGLYRFLLKLPPRRSNAHNLLHSVICHLQVKCREHSFRDEVCVGLQQERRRVRPSFIPSIECVRRAPQRGEANPRQRQRPRTRALEQPRSSQDKRGHAQPLQEVEQPQRPPLICTMRSTCGHGTQM